MNQANPMLGVVEKTVLAYVMVFVALGVYLSVFNQTYFDTVYTLEDGILEWLTVVALSTSMVVCGQRLVRTGFSRGVPFFFVTLFLTAFFLFGAGEEISWGQRIFAIESSEFFLENNAQKETNLHNMMINGEKINQLIFGKLLSLVLLIYVAVLTPLYHKQPAIKRWLDNWAVPIPKTYQAWGYVVILLIVEVVIKQSSDTLRRGELTEFAASFWVMLNIAYPHNLANFRGRENA